MFRVARNITLLLIVCFIASGIPLYADTIDIDLNLSIGATSKGNLSLDVQLNQISSSNWDVAIILSTDGKTIPVNFNPNNPFSIDLYHNNLHIQQLNLLDIADNLPDFTSELLVEDSILLTFSLLQEELDLPDGDYRLEIKPTIRDYDEKIEPLNIAFNFNTNYNYIPSLQSINRNETALLLYFPDPQYNNLIPITRIIPYTNTPLRATINNLQMGPIEELGLPIGSHIPPSSGLSLSRGIANVYLPNDVSNYGISSAGSYIVVNSIVNSLASINEVNGVQFYFGGQIREVGFHDMTMDKPHYPSEEQKTYVGVMTENNRVLLTPIYMYENQTTVESVFNNLKYEGNPNIYRYGVIPPIPASVELLSHTLEDGVLTLELNEAFLEVYSGSNHKQAFMLEALLYSLTSLDNIDSVIFKVNNNPISSFGGIQLQNPVKPSKYINPEK